MPSDKKFPLSVAITAIDQVTHPLGRITKSLDKTTKKIKSLNKSFYEKSGINQLQETIHSLNKSTFGFTKALGLNSLSNSARGASKKTIGAISAIQNSISSLLKTGLGAGLVIGGVGFGAKTLVSGASRETLEMKDSAERLNMNPQALSELKYVGELKGVNFEALTSSFQTLSQNLLALKLGKMEGNHPLRWMVNPKDQEGRDKSLETLTLEIAEKVSHSKASPQVKEEVVSQIFGSKDFLKILKLGRAGITEKRQEARENGVHFDPASLKTAERFNESLAQLTSKMGAIKTQLGSALLPAATEALAELGLFLKKNEVGIQSFSKSLGEHAPKAIALLAQSARGAISVIHSFSPVLSFLNRNIGVLNLALGYLASKFAFGVVPSILGAVKALMSLGGALLLPGLNILGVGITALLTPVGAVAAGILALTAAVAALLAYRDEIKNLFRLDDQPYGLPPLSGDDKKESEVQTENRTFTPIKSVDFNNEKLKEYLIHSGLKNEFKPAPQIEWDQEKLKKFQLESNEVGAPLQKLTLGKSSPLVNALQMDEKVKGLNLKLFQPHPDSPSGTPPLVRSPLKNDQAPEAFDQKKLDQLYKNLAQMKSGGGEGNLSREPTSDRKVDVSVSFENAPRGMRARVERSDIPIKIGMGYALQGGF